MAPVPAPVPGVAIDGDWANAPAWGTPIAIAADAPETHFTTGRQALPMALADNEDTRFAICVTVADSDGFQEFDIDSVRLEKLTASAL